MVSTALKQIKKSAAKPFPKVPVLIVDQSFDVSESLEVPDTPHEQLVDPDHKAAESEAMVTEDYPTVDPDAADVQAISDQTKDLISDLIKKSFATTVRVVSMLEQMELERKNLERTEIASSHARLYAILTKCYQFYETMKASTTSKEVRKQMTQGLSQFIEIRGFKTLEDTHDMNRVVKAVFGEDRRRVSAYASVLRVALTAGPANLDGVATAIPTNGLAGWIAKQGGIEEIRKVGKTTGVTVKQRVETAEAAVKDKSLMTFKPDAKTMPFGTDDADRMMMLIVTYRPTGELEINSVVKSGAVLRAALSAHYTANKDAMANVQITAAPKPQSAVSIALGNTSI